MTMTELVTFPMPTTLPPREPLATMLLDIARCYVAAGFFLVAIALLRAHLSPWAHAVFRIGKRIGG
jgi:hypothetical protein